MKNYNKGKKLFYLYMMIFSVLFYLCVKSKIVHKSFKISKNSIDKKFTMPEPVRNQNMNYVPCCCYTKLGYYGWYHEIPKNINEYCNKYFSCLKDSFIGDCPNN